VSDDLQAGHTSQQQVGDRGRAAPRQGYESDGSHLETGALVLVECCLTRDDARRRHLVLARRMTKVIDPDPIEGNEPPTGPHAHERVGHFRRVSAGTARERMIWVRPAVVMRLGPRAVDDE
jgi:hypothetical protein